MEGSSVIVGHTPSPNYPLTVFERDVLSALEMLPSQYEVQVTPSDLGFPGGEQTFRYEPDFVVTGPDGRRVIIEVKSSRSLSWSNLAKLAAIGRTAERHGDKFVVFVLGAEAATPASRPQGLERLNLSFVVDRAEIKKKVLEELAAPPAGGIVQAT